MRAFAMALTGCLFLMSMTQASQAQTFALEKFFAGKTTATGKFSAINGVRREFDVDLTGRWNGKTLTLVEDFRYKDGEKDRKTWRFVKTGPTTYKGTREDVVGETSVRVDDNVATFTYVVYLDPANRANKVRFWDRMVLNNDGTVVNTALVTKFGFPVATTRVDFKR